MVKIDEIIRTRRKTIALIVHSDGRVIVRAPLRASARQIQAMVDQKADWIRAKQELLKQHAPAGPLPKHYQDGEFFWYLGQQYPLQIVARARTPLRLDGVFQLDRAALEQAAEVFTHWYREQARAYLSQAAAAYAAQYGFHFERIKITSAQTRWGSCSSKGTLSFTWRLIMAPRDVVDYVVIHELVHTMEHNHGPRFWARVGQIVPDYKQKVAWLKENGSKLTL